MIRIEHQLAEFRFWIIVTFSLRKIRQIITVLVKDKIFSEKKSQSSKIIIKLVSILDKLIFNMLRPTVTTWTSSHAHNGDFKKQLKDLFKSKSDRFEKPIVFSKGSLKMSYNISRKIIKDIESQSGNPQIHVILLGDNNLRWLKNDANEVLAMFQFLLSRTKDVRKCKIIVGTLIPTLENIENNLDTFINFDQALSEILDPKYEMLDLRKSLKSKNGEIKEKYYKSDGVHLNRSGAKVLTQQIFNKVQRFPRSFFE